MTQTNGRYPKREAYFSHRFCRLLAKTTAAQSIGAEACWMLTIIAQTEDAKRYSAPVLFWNEQLMAVCGFGGRGRLVRARGKAIEAGWLHYEPGSKSKAGKYWVEIPPQFANLPDSAIDENPTEYAADSVPNQNGKGGMNGSDSVPNQNGKSGFRSSMVRQADGKRAPFYPSPFPTGVENPAFGKWCSSLRVEEFQSPGRGIKRFAETVEKGFLRRDDRFRFMGLWFDTAVKAEQGKIQNAAKVFIANLKTALGGGEWFGSDALEADVQAFLVEWDRQHQGEPNVLVDEAAGAFGNVEVPVDE